MTKREARKIVRYGMACNMRLAKNNVFACMASWWLWDDDGWEDPCIGQQIYAVSRGWA